MRIISIIYDQIINFFLRNLKLSGLSENSIKFYKSDISSFIAWLKNEVKKTGVLPDTFNELLPFIKSSFAENYKKYLILRNTPPATINRKLSVIRKFSDFLHSEGLLSFNFAKNLQNITSSGLNKVINFYTITDHFKKHLEESKASKNTIKNYLADVHHFLNWIDTHHATT